MPTSLFFKMSGVIPPLKGKWVGREKDRELGIRKESDRIIR
jgi:hypothetical protein